MASLWSLGGLSLLQLLRRTARESWEDSVFGQGGRMAFYQFLALFPTLVVFISIASQVSHFGQDVNNTVRDVGGQVLPDQVSQLVQSILNELGHHLSGFRFISICATALWAAFNSTWAMIYGLNRAYEVQERRSWQKMTLTIVALTFASGAIGGVAIFLIVAVANLAAQLHSGLITFRVIEWLTLAVAVYLFMAVLYRFGPDTPDHEWRWSTPGALCALIIWIASILVARFYFERVADYSQSYGFLNSVAILLVWLYVSNGAILIGGEMNSEIKKASNGRSMTAPVHFEAARAEREAADE